ncbi:enoyl-CoA hydratase/isomerase family protein [Marinomonas communis]|uniref:Enoyl-CoA hydratase/carnithine racemase n=1 Tax=Marinomonas communis TaxID=28254 RepID=A0A4R6X0L5_9GAMM|nr:enoyl-CoA hydratase/isomerase family protein [Marinomonas communis]TDR05888.1 enoyl-CoA hydratase/carnithine racemase [Marinomonas communis]
MTQASEAGVISLSIDNGIAQLRIQRAAKLNCLTLSMLQQLESHLDQIELDSSIRAVVLLADEGKAFCAGADIQAWKDLSPLDMWRLWVQQGHRIFDRLERLRQPVVAVISGLALGGGLELAAAADVRIATKNARFALPEASIATCPGWSGSQRLVKEMGAGWVKAMALFGKWWSAEEALQAGFIQSLAADYQSACDDAQFWAESAARSAPISIQLNKQLVNAAMGVGLASTLEAMASAVAGGTQDALEGKHSFFEKRTPNFEGK